MLKRALDLLIAATAFVLAVPLFVLVAPILRLTGEGEVFFKQYRVGIGGRSFEIFKFATMLKDSPRTGTLTAPEDPRILPVGRFLRKTKINELPQLLNVLRGEMSLVGPRPLAECEFVRYSTPVMAVIASVQPGLTGVGSLVFRDEEEILARSQKTPEDCYYHDILPLKGMLEEWYVANRSLRLDLEIILLTGITVLFPRSQLHRWWLKGLPVSDASVEGDRETGARFEPQA
jgi:lipopolysaccharide/colanic/teichoic acid biosynthesis glycosyltransferase